MRPSFHVGTFSCRVDCSSQLFALMASRGKCMAISPCTALRVRCVARSAGGTRKLASLRHRAHLFPGSSVLLARADGDLGSVHIAVFLG